MGFLAKEGDVYPLHPLDIEVGQHREDSTSVEQSKRS